jgi:hypothetical protein
MWELDEGELLRFRCHVGHTYVPELMSVALDETLRRSLANGRAHSTNALRLRTQISSLT